ncbi:HPr-rel-A system PqqD family peptide chaperone [Sphingomonas sp.]|uniref:HPr-rel-A system PqqD family peptide chaperone n=1 Tax=Sphingomonas sp. TaxID=28214 RepID=UPI0025F37464|nr:HPr-rel-A system PqqD family peptide chaperone [Sphingomonas sp.]
MRYRADPQALLQIVPLDVLTAIYHRRSGQTHLGAEPVPEILGVLNGSDGTVVEILDRLGIQEAVETRARLQERLDEMVATGLLCLR